MAGAKTDGIAVVGERPFALGFRLVGVRDTFIAEGEGAAAELARAFESGKYGLIIASGSVKSFIPDSQLYIMERSRSTLVLFVPLEGGGIESVEELAKRVLGVTIKGI